MQLLSLLISDGHIELKNAVCDGAVVATEAHADSSAFDLALRATALARTLGGEICHAELDCATLADDEYDAIDRVLGHVLIGWDE